MCKFHFTGNKEAVNPKKVGTKCAAWYQLDVGTQETVQIRVRLYHHTEKPACTFGHDFEEIFQTRKDEADAFYEEVKKKIVIFIQN